MKVSEWIAELQKLDGDRVVIMATDAEGNGYSPLSGMWVGAYRPDTTWSGKVGFESLTDEDRLLGYTEEDVIEDGQPAVILCPAN